MKAFDAMRKAILLTAKITALIVGIPVGLFVILEGLLLFNRGYSWSEMDWNSDGWTTAGEILSAIDVGSTDVQRDALICREFYSCKDGMPIRTDCPVQRDREREPQICW
jgi:hypothetical protein